MARAGNSLADDVEPRLVVLRDRDAVQLHDLQHLVAVAPFVHLDLVDGGLLHRVLHRTGVVLVSE